MNFARDLSIHRRMSRRVECSEYDNKSSTMTTSTRRMGLSFQTRPFDSRLDLESAL